MLSLHVFASVSCGSRRHRKDREVHLILITESTSVLQTIQFEISPSCRSEQSAVSPLVTFALATFQSTNTGMKLQYEEVRALTGAQVM